MAWVCVGFNGEERVCQSKPTRYGDRYWMMNPICNDSVGLPKGTIKKLIGRELSFTDEPVELGQIKNEKGYLYLRHNYKGCYVCKGL